MTLGEKIAKHFYAIWNYCLKPSYISFFPSLSLPLLIFLQFPLNSVQWHCKWVVLPHISALLMPFINLEPWACSEMVRYSIFPWSFGEGWQLTYSFCNQTSLVVMSFLILIKWKGMHVNLEPLKAGREAQWHTHNVHSHSVTLHCAGANQVFLYLFTSLFAFCTWQRMNSCPGASSPPREPHMQLPVAAQGLATLKYIYSGSPVRADPKSWTPSLQSVNAVLFCNSISLSALLFFYPQHRFLNPTVSSSVRLQQLQGGDVFWDLAKS